VPGLDPVRHTNSLAYSEIWVFQALCREKRQAREGPNADSRTTIRPCFASPDQSEQESDEQVLSPARARRALSSARRSGAGDDLVETVDDLLELLFRGPGQPPPDAFDGERSDLADLDPGSLG